MSVNLLILSGLLIIGQTPVQSPTQTPQTPVQTPQTPVATNSQATFSLKFTPTEGASTTYKVSGTMDIAGTASTWDSKVVQKVLKVDPDGTYSMQGDTVEGKVEMSGQELPMPKSSTVTVYKPTGEVVSVSGSQVDQTIMRSQNLTMLKRPDAPVKVGETWTVAVKPDTTAKRPSVQGTFTFDGDDTIGTYHTYKIEAKVAEGDTPIPGNVISTYWINKDDGAIIKYDCHYSNVTFPGAVAPLSGTIAMLRLDK